MDVSGVQGLRVTPLGPDCWLFRTSSWVPDPPKCDTYAGICRCYIEPASTYDVEPFHWGDKSGGCICTVICYSVSYVNDIVTLFGNIVSENMGRLYIC